MTNEISHLLEIIETHRSFLLLSHVDPDGDAIGSLIAFALLIERKGKKAVAYDQDGVPEIYRFLKGCDRIVSVIPPAEHFEVAVFLECPDVRRAGTACSPFIEKIPLWVNIDHHMENSRFGHLNIIDENLSALGETLFDLYRESKEPMDSAVAEALYAAIMTDTGSFKYINTTPRAHEISAQLIRLGINPYRMYEEIFETLSRPAALIAARAHSTLEIDNGISCITITLDMFKETGSTADDTQEIVNLGRNIKDVEVALLFRETANGVKVSLRSKHNVNVNEIAVKFGGGGHLRAAGCTIEADMKHAKEMIFAAVRKALQEASGHARPNER
ncbi:bifunctional oligoribonuclease/PAP phosphatase NrnA [Candidatus Poribacteria bacterium]|nr:bifunctional oligoribonuclease/PAP phosphatase NrnA [Candidatus Poribacteria bacterium]